MCDKFAFTTSWKSLSASDRFPERSCCSARAKVSVVGLSQIVFAMGFDVWFAQRSFNPATLLGIGLVMAPVVWLLTKPK